MASGSMPLTNCRRVTIPLSAVAPITVASRKAALHVRVVVVLMVVQLFHVADFVLAATGMADMKPP